MKKGQVDRNQEYRSMEFQRVDIHKNNKGKQKQRGRNQCEQCGRRTYKPINKSIDMGREARRKVEKHGSPRRDQRTAMKERSTEVVATKEGCRTTRTKSERRGKRKL